MRNAYTATLLELARKNKDIFAMTADTGIFIFDKFIAEFPGRFINVGIAEANMAGIAAGLALSGKIPFMYAIASFLTMRPFEQIRNDICYQNLNVKIVGVGSGFAYGTHGPTHHALEDIAILRAIPNITIICPADPVESAKATSAIAGYTGPVYLRLGKNGEPVIYQQDYQFKIGKAVVLYKGSDVALIATGVTVFYALQAARQLKERGINAEVINMHTVKPLDEAVVMDVLSRIGRIVSVEEHSIIGGLGGAIAELIAEKTRGDCRLLRLGIRDKFVSRCATYAELQEDYGLSAAGITRAVEGFI